MGFQGQNSQGAGSNTRRIRRALESGKIPNHGITPWLLRVASRASKPVQQSEPRSTQETDLVNRLRKEFSEQNSTSLVLMDLLTNPDLTGFLKERNNNEEVNTVTTLNRLIDFKNDFFTSYDKWVEQVKNDRGHSSQSDSLLANVRVMVRPLKEDLEKISGLIPPELTTDNSMEENNIRLGCRAIQSLSEQFSKLLTCLSEQHQPLPQRTR